MNIPEKILAKASGKNTVHPGEIVDANVDMAMVHDLTGPLAVEAIKKIGIKELAMKPLAMKDIAEMIRRVLDEKIERPGKPGKAFKRV